MTRWILLTSLALAAAALVVACGQKEEQAQIKETAEDIQVASPKIVDPVCGMEIDPKTAVTAVHMGQTYHFCSTQCRDQFLENPEKYMSNKHMEGDEEHHMGEEGHQEHGH